MTLRRWNPASGEESLRELFARLVEDGKRFVRAEIDLYKQIALGRIVGLKTAAIYIVVAILLVQASLTTLLVGIGLAIARWLGPGGGVIAAAVLGLAVSGLLLRAAVGRIGAVAGGGGDVKAAGQ